MGLEGPGNGGPADRVGPRPDSRCVFRRSSMCSCGRKLGVRLGRAVHSPCQSFRSLFQLRQVMESAAIEGAELRVGGKEAKAATSCDRDANASPVDGYDVGVGVGRMHVDSSSRSRQGAGSVCDLGHTWSGVGLRWRAFLTALHRGCTHTIDDAPADSIAITDHSPDSRRMAVAPRPISLLNN